MTKFKIITIQEKEYTALKLTSSYFVIPPSTRQREREDGMLVKNGSILPFKWYGTTRESDGEYLLLEKSNLEDITLITTKYRHNALDFIRKIAYGLKKGGRAFLDLECGIFPLSRIYIENGEYIVLLPPDAEAVIFQSESVEEREKSVGNLISPNHEKSFTLTNELVQLMYAAISGRFPYEMKEVRLSSFIPYALSLYDEKEKETVSFIMESLTLNENEERKLCGNNDALYPLDWFLLKTEALKWDYSPITDEERILSIKNSEESEKFKREKIKKEKTAERRKFLREKGPLTLTVLLVVSILSFFVGNFLYQKFRAPVTKDMTKEEIIHYTIEKQNELDANSINEPFTTEAAQYKEVSALYVINKTRLSYEGKEPFISVESWLENKDSVIDEDSFVYGALIVDITETGENEYKTLLDWYTPYAERKEEDEAYPEKDGYNRTYLYSVEENFVFKYNRRGWWECTGSDFSNVSLKSVIYIPESTGEVAPD